MVRPLREPFEAIQLVCAGVPLHCQAHKLHDRPQRHGRDIKWLGRAAPSIYTAVRNGKTSYGAKSDGVTDDTPAIK